jgi:cell division protein FtsQ
MAEEGGVMRLPWTSAGSEPRQKAARMRVWTRAAVALAVGLLVGAGGYLLTHGEAFALQRVVVEGNRHLDRYEVVGLMGLKGGENLVTMDLEDLYERLQDSPWLLSVQLRKDLPGTLIVRVAEAEPHAVLRTPLSWFLMGRDGVLLEEISGPSEHFLPVIEHVRAEGGEAMDAALELAGVLKAELGRFGQGPVVIHGLLQGAEELMVRLGDVDVKVGVGDYEAKLARLLELSDEIRRRAVHIDYIDLRFDNRVVVKVMAEGRS